MINPSRDLQELEARVQREAYGDLTYAQALERFTALWVEARLLNPDLGRDWLADLEADRAVARAVNGLSPTA